MIARPLPLQQLAGSVPHTGPCARGEGPGLPHPSAPVENHSWGDSDPRTRSRSRPGRRPGRRAVLVPRASEERPPLVPPPASCWATAGRPGLRPVTRWWRFPAGGAGAGSSGAGPSGAGGGRAKRRRRAAPPADGRPRGDDSDGDAIARAGRPWPCRGHARCATPDDPSAVIHAGRRAARAARRSRGCGGRYRPGPVWPGPRRAGEPTRTPSAPP
jgi:hypothetical protein